MENMDKGLTVLKWGLIVRPKIPHMPTKFLAQFVCPSPKVWDFRKKTLSGCPQSVVTDIANLSILIKSNQWSFNFHDSIKNLLKWSYKVMQNLMVAWSAYQKSQISPRWVLQYFFAYQTKISVRSKIVEIKIVTICKLSQVLNSSQQ